MKFGKFFPFPKTKMGDAKCICFQFNNGKCSDPNASGLGHVCQFCLVPGHGKKQCPQSRMPPPLTNRLHRQQTCLRLLGQSVSGSGRLSKMMLLTAPHI